MQGEGAPVESLLGARLRDIDLADSRDGGALRNVWREQAESVLFGRGFNGPPNRVPTRAARCERHSVAEWARVAFEGGEDDTALARLVAVLEQVTGHGLSLPPKRQHDIGASP
jgi:hypothetical protein